MNAFRMVLLLIAAVAVTAVAEAMVFKSVAALGRWWQQRKLDRGDR